MKILDILVEQHSHNRAVVRKNGRSRKNSLKNDPKNKLKNDLRADQNDDAAKLADRFGVKSPPKNAPLNGKSQAATEQGVDSKDLGRKRNIDTEDSMVVTDEAQAALAKWDSMSKKKQDATRGGKQGFITGYINSLSVAREKTGERKISARVDPINTQRSAGNKKPRAILRQTGTTNEKRASSRDIAAFKQAVKDGDWEKAEKLEAKAKKNNEEENKKKKHAAGEPARTAKAEARVITPDDSPKEILKKRRNAKKKFADKIVKATAELETAEYNLKNASESNRAKDAAKVKELKDQIAEYNREKDAI